MAWNYRKRIKVAPGVYINVSKGGVSTSVGVRGASVTFGENGTYVNTGIPGTGFYNRQKISGGKKNVPMNFSQIPATNNTDDNGCMIFFALILSLICMGVGFVMLINGVSALVPIALMLFGLAGTYSMLSRLNGNTPDTQSQWVNKARVAMSSADGERKKILQNFVDCFELVKLIEEEEQIIKGLEEQAVKKDVTGILSEHNSKLQEAKDKLTSVQIDVDAPLTEEQKSMFKTLCERFEHLLDTDKVWIITDETAVTLAKSSAKRSLNRKEASLYAGIFNYLKSIFDIPVFDTGTTKYYIYPQYIIKATNAVDFSILPHTTSSISFLPVRFQEDETAPNDARFLNYTWQYVNKNGGPDKRFSNNRQIPVYAYAQIDISFANTVTSFMLSQQDFADKFVLAYYSFASCMTAFNGANSQEEAGVQSNVTKVLDNYINYGSIVSAASNLYDHLKVMCRREDVKNTLEEHSEELSSIDSLEFTINPRIAFMAFSDVLKCYKGLGYSTNLNEQESIGLAIFAIKILNEDVSNIVYSESLMRSRGIDTIRSFVNTFETSVKTEFPEDKFFVVELMRVGHVDEEVINKYAVLLYRFASILAKIDGTISESEAKYLTHISSFTSSGSNVRKDPKEDRKREYKTPKKGDAIKSLNSLIGLDAVKDEVNKLLNFIKVQQLRQSKGMNTVPMTYHCVFTGNPGTGKTTVARILAEVYHEMGILKKGHLIETDRSGLVAEYVGQTAVKTNKIIDSALDGVLFIDEAYSLVQGGGNDFGMEAISTLLKRMEDDRDRLIVILAGYGEEMKTFIDSNPGLQSRFNRYIHFPDYSTNNLMDIFKMSIKKYDYILDINAETKLRELFDKAIENKDKNFGNGRFARNILEKVMENQAVRLASEANISEEMLQTISQEDIP